MALIDDIIAFFETPSWATRAMSSIELISPEGRIFTAKFTNSIRSKEKKLGLQDSPKVKGTNVQDLGVKSETHSIPVIFDGIDNDIDADNFYNAIDETGVWNVMHPVRGALKLQPVRVTEPIDPVGSGNVTVLATEWIVPAEKPVLKTESELKSQVDVQKGVVDEKSALQLDANAVQDSAGDIEAIKGETQSSVAKFKKTIGAVTQVSADVQSAINSIYSGVQSTIDSAIIPILSLGGQINELTELPQLISQDFKARFESYKDLANQIFNDKPDESNLVRLKNKIAVQESFLTGIVAGSALIVTSSTFNSRSEAINAIDEIKDLFENMVYYLDETQTTTQSGTIETQFFTQSEAFVDLYRLVSLSIEYLLLASFSLKTEKIIKVKNPTNTWMFAIREYSKTGLVNQSNTDEFYDLLINTNDLNRDEIYLLPTGKEMRIYVGG